jgi:hypothetical protein
MFRVGECRHVKRERFARTEPFFDPGVDPGVEFKPDLTRVRRIGFLVYPDVEIIDLCGTFGRFCLCGPLDQN